MGTDKTGRRSLSQGVWLAVVLTLIGLIVGLCVELVRQDAKIDRLSDHREQPAGQSGKSAARPKLPQTSTHGEVVVRFAIEFTQVPGPGGGGDSHGDIAGRIVGLPNPQRYKIVIYAHTDRWYVQPLVVTALTDIERDGSWKNWTHLGLEYAALVVVPSYEPQSIIEKLPSRSDEVLVIATTKAR